MITATVVADSISGADKRITTLSLKFPRFVLAELNTHRMLSRNSASSRAIPTRKLIEEIKADPAMPVFWGQNQPGMQAGSEIDWQDRRQAIDEWLYARDAALDHAQKLVGLGLHKQIVNRVVEPFMYARTVVTATEWNNFYQLRRHKDAQPEIKALADAMWDAMHKSQPTYLKQGEWHVPYFKQGEDEKLSLAHSVARCARVSYLTHEGKQTTGDDDLRLATRLAQSGHWSPFEHQATPLQSHNRSNNFWGWKQHREMCENEPDWQIDKRCPSH